MDLASGSAWNLFVLDGILRALHLASGSLLLSTFCCDATLLVFSEKKKTCILSSLSGLMVCACNGEINLVKNVLPPAMILLLITLGFSMVRMDQFVAEQQIHHQAVHCHLHHGFLHS